jgi:hypothetical protein
MTKITLKGEYSEALKMPKEILFNITMTRKIDKEFNKTVLK